MLNTSSSIKLHRLVPFVNCALNNICNLNGMIYNSREFSFGSLDEINYSPAFLEFSKKNYNALKCDFNEEQLRTDIKLLAGYRHTFAHPERRKKIEIFEYLRKDEFKKLLIAIGKFLFANQFEMMLKKNNDPYQIEIQFDGCSTNSDSLNNFELNEIYTEIVQRINNFANLNNGSVDEQLKKWAGKQLNRYLKTKFNLTEDGDIQLKFDVLSTSIKIINKVFLISEITVSLNDITDIKKIKPSFFSYNNLNPDETVFLINQYHELLDFSLTKIMQNIIKMIYKVNRNKIELDLFNKTFGVNFSESEIKVTRNCLLHFSYFSNEDTRIISQFLYVLINFQSQDDHKQKCEKILESLDFSVVKKILTEAVKINPKSNN
jgi:hypothetical protein